MCFKWNEISNAVLTVDDTGVRMEKDLQGFSTVTENGVSVSSISARNLKPGSFTIIAVPADLRSRSRFYFLTFHYKSALPFY